MAFHTTTVTLRLVSEEAPQEVRNVFILYAVRIGCAVVGDEVHADIEQAKKLIKWWEQY